LTLNGSKSIPPAAGFDLKIVEEDDDEEEGGELVEEEGFSAPGEGPEGLLKDNLIFFKPSIHSHQ
jgi:hypothetical protein